MRQVTRKSLMTVAAATGVIAAAGGYAHADSGANGIATDSPGVLSGNSVQAPVNVPVNVCGNTIDVVGALNPTFGNSCANKGGGARSGGYGDQRGGGHGGGHGDHQGGGYGDHQGGGGRGGNHGGNHGGGNHGGSHGGSGAHGGSGGAHAGGHTGGSPGVGSGNHVQAPIDVPVNVCGNSIDVVGILNPSFGNDCANDSGTGAHTPPSRGHETPGKPGEHGPGKPGGHGQSNPSRPGGVPSTSDHVTPAGASAVHRPAAHAAQLAHTGSELPMGLALPAGAGALLAGAVLYRKARPSA
ncbi:chaplin [Streptomyces asoensis]|uniref:Chaplin n=1 Tax=Streptomyces asoensis TaxID=249586 RepID=A0A6M4WLK2_9ACTN|nr:chaplin [Streptomyces asoensis]QJT00671.1 chaplin [Streptomyces asoensis]